MKSLIIEKPHSYRIVEQEIPVLNDEYDVLVKMKAAGVCGTDYHIYHGKNPNSKYPLIPGHENVGIVEKIGEKVSKVKVGDHVVVDLIITCGECYQCTHGRSNVCENVLVRGSGTNGGFTEFLVAPETDLYIVDKKMPFSKAVLAEPYTVGAHSTKRARVVSDDVVFILGTGTIGTIILQTCKAKGATVICCDINDDSLERAKSYGADYIINSKKENLLDKVLEFTDGKGVTVAFDSACFKGSLTMIMQKGLVRNAGRIVPLGFVTEFEEISQAMINQRELDIIGTRMSENEFENVIKNLEDNIFETDGIVTEYINFSEIDKVFYRMDNPTGKTTKMVILFD